MPSTQSLASAQSRSITKENLNQKENKSYNNVQNKSDNSGDVTTDFRCPLRHNLTSFWLPFNYVSISKQEIEKAALQSKSRWRNHKLAMKLNLSITDFKKKIVLNFTG